MSLSLSRRSFFSFAAGGGLILASGTASRALAQTAATPEAAPTGPFTLPDLPYAFDALEPHIDAMTMEIHHDRHHASFVTNLNNLAAEHPELEAMSIEEIVADLDSVPEEIRTAVRNNGGGHLNHSWFWETMSPDGGTPEGDLLAAIERDFGSVDTMQVSVNEAGVGQFGSGWAWVVMNDGALSVITTPNQDNPLMDGSGTPILGVDVWEHAYYLKYQNKRADYLTAWWNVVNWQTVADRFTAAGM